MTSASPCQDPTPAGGFTRRRRYRAVGALLLLALLAGCGHPFVDSRREAGSQTMVGASRPDRPVICYAPSVTTPADVRAMAAEVCASSDRVPRLVQDGGGGGCRLMQPRRAVFECVEGAGAIRDDLPRVGRSRAAPAGASSWSGAIYPGGRLPAPPRLD